MRVKDILQEIILITVAGDADKLQKYFNTLDEKALEQLAMFGKELTEVCENRLTYGTPK